jgi:hypothetical protein
MIQAALKNRYANARIPAAPLLFSADRVDYSNFREGSLDPSAREIETWFRFDE